MTADYLQWPGQSDDSILVSDYLGQHSVPCHKHHFVEIVMILKGSCRHQYLNHETILTAGDAFIVVPHETHSYSIDTEMRICNIIFSPGILENEWMDIRTMSGFYSFVMLEPFFRFETRTSEIVHLQQETLVHASRLIDTIRHEQETRPSGYRLVQKASLIALIALIGRTREQHMQTGSHSLISRQNLIEDAMAYIEDNLQDTLSVPRLAAQVYLSPDYFRKVFKEATGLSPIVYINSRRLAKASELLEKTRMSISEIALEVGFSDIAYFAKIFRSHFGCSATAYRKKTDFS